MRNKINESLKFYRYKKRFSFITEDKLFRIDITAVKNNSYNPSINSYNLYKSFKDSNVLNEPEQYELEIEYIGLKRINGVVSIQNYMQNKEKLVNVLDDNTYTSPLLIVNIESLKLNIHLEIMILNQLLNLFFVAIQD